MKHMNKAHKDLKKDHSDEVFCWNCYSYHKLSNCNTKKTNKATVYYCPCGADIKIVTKR